MKQVSTTVLLLLSVTLALAADDEGEKLLRALQSNLDPNLENSISTVDLHLKFKTHSEFCKFVSQNLKDDEADINKNQTDKAKGLKAAEDLVPVPKGKKIPSKEQADECRKEENLNNASSKKTDIVKLFVPASKLVEYQHEVKNDKVATGQQINESFYNFLKTYLAKAKRFSGTVESGWQIETRPSLGTRATEAVGEALFDPTPQPLEKIKIPEDQKGTN